MAPVLRFLCCGRAGQRAIGGILAGACLLVGQASCRADPASTAPPAVMPPSTQPAEIVAIVRAALLEGRKDPIRPLVQLYPFPSRVPADDPELPDRWREGLVRAIMRSIDQVRAYGRDVGIDWSNATVDALAREPLSIPSFLVRSGAQTMEVYVPYLTDGAGRPLAHPFSGEWFATIMSRQERAWLWEHQQPKDAAEMRQVAQLLLDRRVTSDQLCWFETGEPTLVQLGMTLRIPARFSRTAPDVIEEISDASEGHTWSLRETGDDSLIFDGAMPTPFFPIEFRLTLDDNDADHLSERDSWTATVSFLETAKGPATRPASVFDWRCEFRRVQGEKLVFRTPFVEERRSGGMVLVLVDGVVYEARFGNEVLRRPGDPPATRATE